MPPRAARGHAQKKIMIIIFLIFNLLKALNQIVVSEMRGEKLYLA
ncbi:MAG TPA: hypothetical protein PLL08_06940 [Bacteroidales bacterium]|nr:hypothetical protein [Bacteroidales bacterium]HRR03720.1 hypothetical protein [Bacteroidales bacterium]HXK74622.1 hypothetical protein [Bacteroidales bacterium]